MSDTSLLGCHEIRNLLPDYLNGGVGLETAQKMRWHFGQCRDCRLIVGSAIETFRAFFEEKHSRKSMQKSHAA